MECTNNHINNIISKLNSTNEPNIIHIPIVIEVSQYNGIHNIEIKLT